MNYFYPFRVFQKFSIEEMDRIAREAFAKKWEQDELLNKSAE